MISQSHRHLFGRCLASLLWLGSLLLLTRRATVVSGSGAFQTTLCTEPPSIAN